MYIYETNNNHNTNNEIINPTTFILNYAYYLTCEIEKWFYATWTIEKSLNG